MLNKKVKTLLFIFLILFCISVVNAESIDNNTDYQSVDIVNVKSDAYVAVIDDTVETVGNFSDLNKSINTHNEDSELILNKNYTYDKNTDVPFKEGIIISKNITINGQGHTINGNYTARIFNVTSDTVLTLKNINLINGNLTQGGAIYNNGNLNIYNSTFYNNTATNQNRNENVGGGAIYNNGNLNIYNSTFYNNSAYRISSTSRDISGGGAIFNLGNITLNNSIFYNNNIKQDSTYGGAICNIGNITINNSNFTQNIGRTAGGAIYSNGNITINNSNFKNNTGQLGGAIDCVSITIINSNFTQHNGGTGGVMFVSKNAYIINSTFQNNTNYDEGAAVIFTQQGNITIVNSTFEDNKGTYSNGGVIHSNSDGYGTINITNSLFINNCNVDRDGGVIYANIVIINNSTFINNSAKGNGGVIYSDYILNINNSNFINNSAKGNGGAIFSSYILNINDSNFINNSGYYGGAIYIRGNATINNSLFINNNITSSYSLYSGGAIYNKGNITINNSNFTQNTAPSNGGAIYSTGNTIINNTNFSNNAADNGGAIYIAGNTIINNTNFSNNAADNGGAIYIYSRANNINIIDSEFKFNNATNGGAIYYVNIIDSLINSINKYFEELVQQIKSDDQLYNEILEAAEKENMSFDEYIEKTRENMIKQALENYPEINNTNSILKITNSNFDKNNGKFGDDIYTLSNILISNNNYTKDSFANIYANNTIINGTIVSVLENNTYYLNFGDIFKLNATVFVDGASINGYNIIITDGTKNYTAIYKGYGIYEITGDISVDFIINHYSAVISADNEGYYIVENGTVSTEKENINIEIELNPTVAGENITGNITLRDENGEIANITGQVTVEIEGKNFTVDIVNGSGKLNIEDQFGPGNYTMNVNFQGQGKYNSANNSTNLTIEDNGIVLEVHDLTKYYGNNSQLIIILTDAKGNPIADQIINITINGVTYTRVTDSEGRILMNINLIPGVYEAEVSYGDITENATVTVLSTIEAEDLIKYFLNGTQYYAKFYNVDGTPLANTNVTFNIHGVFYTRTTDENGIAKLNINLNPGEYIITAYNPVNNESKSYIVTVLTTIIGEDVVKFYRNGTQYYAYVLDLDGTPLVNGTVTFNIHGVFYTRTTNEEGIVKLNIKLNPGEYIVTAWNSVNNESYSNKVTVYNVVESQDIEMTTSARKPFTVTILGDHGAPLPNANVTFNIHGVFYYKTTDANGQISLDINLVAGKYIITTYYNEYAVSNTIIVK